MFMTQYPIWYPVIFFDDVNEILRIFLAYVYLLVISYDDAVCYNFRLDQIVSRDLVC